MGFAGAGVVLVDMLASLTLLPALLAMWGHRIRAARPARPGAGALAKLAHAVQRRPVAVALAVAAALVASAAPFLGVRYADPDARSLPASSQSRQLADLARSAFPAGTDTDPITVVADVDPASAAFAAYVERLRKLRGAVIAEPRPGLPAGVAAVDVIPRGTRQGPVAMRLVDAVRALDPPFRAQVTGDAAFLADYQDRLGDRLPWSLALIGLATFVLLFLFTGSVIVPLKAIVMNTLSLGAAFGALVWVFQDGHLGWLFGTEALGSLAIATPVLVFAIAFGLSMDYEVFLLSRITEAWRETRDNDAAVRLGLQRTGGIITSAALLMTVVYLGFVAGGFAPVKQVGLGLVVAIVVDATLVRMLLVPATMTLLGRANWWAPRRLRRVHARIGLREAPVPAAGS